MRLCETLEPSVLEAVRQAYRQGHNWQATLRRLLPDADDELEVSLEQYFRELPKIARHPKRGQPVPPKGGAWRD
jgi:hypothetical protein